MLAWPARRTLLIARLRRVAVFSGPCPVRMWERSTTVSRVRFPVRLVRRPQLGDGPAVVRHGSEQVRGWLWPWREPRALLPSAATDSAPAGVSPVRSASPPGQTVGAILRTVDPLGAIRTFSEVSR